MDISQYSLVLSVFILLLAAATLLSMIGYFFNLSMKEKISKITYRTLLSLIGLFSLLATLGALTYQFIYEIPVCPLCWWQRIFMFPIEIVIFVSLYAKSKTNHLITLIMASIGFLFSANHYWGHFEKYVVGNPLLVPCSTSPLVPNCLNSPTISFGFITIPFMAMIVFIVIIWLSHLAYLKKDAE